VAKPSHLQGVTGVAVVSILLCLPCVKAKVALVGLFLISCGLSTGWVARQFVQLTSQTDAPLRAVTGGQFADWPMVEALLDPTNCSQSERQFLACVAMLEKGLDFFDRAVELVPGEPTSFDRFMGLTLRDFQVAQVRLKVTGTVKSFAELLATERSKYIQHATQWMQIRQSSGAHGLVVIRDWLTVELPALKKDPEMALQMVNAYLAVSEDPHTQIMPSHVLQASFGRSGKGFRGFGIELRRLGGHYYLQHILPDFPAYTAGLRPFDILQTINGEPVSEKTLRSLQALLRNSSDIRVEVLRGGRTREFALHSEEHLMPAPVRIERVDTHTLSIKVSRFARGVCEKVEAALIENPQVRELDLNLSSNGGGDISEGSCLLSLVLPPGKVVAQVEEKDGGSRRDIQTVPKSVSFSGPLSVSVNHRTASTAEMVVAALQFHKRAVVVGERTYGKATVQEVVSVGQNPNGPDEANKEASSSPSPTEGKHQQYAWLRTIATLQSPAGTTWHLRGLNPDHLKSDTTALRLNEDPTEWPQHFLSEREK
jgi:C-terminal peptidase prc